VSTYHELFELRVKPQKKALMNKFKFLTKLNLRKPLFEFIATNNAITCKAATHENLYIDL